MKIAVLAAIAALSLTACSMPEEPSSYSDEGKTLQESTDTDAATTDDAVPQWVGNMDSIHVGMSETEVKEILGQPDDTSSSEMELPSFADGETISSTTTMDMWTYGDILSSADGDDIWMLSFTDGNLDSKSRM